MATDKDIIVALEFGSSAIRGIAGNRLPDGSLEILALEHEKTGSDTILRGVIFNIDKTTQAINNIISRMNQKLGRTIVRAYVSIGGQSLRTEKNFINRGLEAMVKVTPEIVDTLMDSNRSTQYPDSVILEALVQEYFLAGRTVTDPVGIQCNILEAHFINVIARQVLKANLEKCMKMAGIEILDFKISPLVLANSLLTENEKRSGCALVDFGAATTTVSVYTGNQLRQLVVIPLGGDSITEDLAKSQTIEKEEAENLKRKHGIAYVPSDNDAPRTYPISTDRSINENELQNIIGARQEEIILNVWEQIKHMSDKLLSGIIIMGGAAQLKDMVEAIKHFTKVDNVKIAKSLITTAKVAPGVMTPQGISIDTLLAILKEGETDCTAETVAEEQESDENTMVTDPTPDNTADDAETTPDDETEEEPKEQKEGLLKKWFKKIQASLEEGDED
ncbi:MAG: cell division protein FtsA [Bacteroidaceae bacterium]|nr:cell division protein FtsA [Bacteroidaceae bacterium]